MKALANFLNANAIVLLIGLIASIIAIYEFVRYRVWTSAPIARMSGWLLRRSFDAPIASPELEATPAPAATQSDDEFTTYLKRSLVHRYDGYGAKARYDYFADCIRAERADDLHRRAFLHLQDRQEFAALAEGLKEWTKIGFDTLVHDSPELQTEDTMHRLYAALLKELQNDNLRATGSGEFARAWAERVRHWRADGY